MKSEAIVLNVIMPLAAGDLCGDLIKSHLLSKAIDSKYYRSDILHSTFIILPTEKNSTLYHSFCDILYQNEE
jgi:hypothetical protein